MALYLKKQEKKMPHIHWYPGHIAKAEKKLKEQINLVDVVIEVLDARIPESSTYPEIENLIKQKPRLILLNKSDLADFEATKKWQSKIKKDTKCPVIITSAGNTKDLNQITNKAIELAQPAILKLMQKGLLPRPARIMVVGMPNVGKSSIINKLIKKSKTKTGAKAGVTRQQQWVRINPRIDLLDTPGIIPLKQEVQEKAYKLAFVNSVSENSYEAESVAEKLIEVISSIYPEVIRKHYNIEDDKEVNVENIALARNWIVQGAKADSTRAANNLLLDFRDGRLGKLTLDKIEE